MLWLSIYACLCSGTTDWIVQQGANSGESQACTKSGFDGRAVANHPINVVFQTTDLDGWPQLVVEVWDKSHDGMKGLVGCGAVWMPSTPGLHTLQVPLWKPMPRGSAGFRETVLPSFYDLTSLRQLAINPLLRHGMQCVTTGEAAVEINVLASNFDAAGVDLG